MCGHSRVWPRALKVQAFGVAVDYSFRRQRQSVLSWRCIRYIPANGRRYAFGATRFGTAERGRFSFFLCADRYFTNLPARVAYSLPPSLRGYADTDIDVCIDAEVRM